MNARPNAILEEFLPQIESACREGRGEELLFAAYQRHAESVADNVFLILQQTATEAENDPDRLLAAMREFTHQRGLGFVELVAEVCSSFGMSREHQAKAETISADAFAERLNLHFTSANWGGSA